jgi:hypothetical protein
MVFDKGTMRKILRMKLITAGSSILAISLIELANSLQVLVCSKDCSC